MPKTFNLTNHKSTQAGFAMPLALGLGLVMIIVAASMIGRSQSDRSTTASQREINRALSISEAGIVRVQSFLDRHKILANKDLNEWSNTLDILSLPQSSCRLINLISAKQQAGLFKNSTWIDLDNSDRNKGRYRITDYKYQNGIGKLTVAGEIDAYNTTQNTSKSTLTVDLPIGSESATIAPPALWANTFNLSANQKITGQIRGVVCPQLPAIDPDGIAGVDVSNIALISGVPRGQIIADPPNSSVWLGPRVIYRWGPTLLQNGNYSDGDGKDVAGILPGAPIEYFNEVLVDRISDRITASANIACESSYTYAVPAVTARQGFYACIAPAKKSVKIWMYKQPNSSAKSQSINALVVTRSN